jgi:potassium efflux system protein
MWIADRKALARSLVGRILFAWLIIATTPGLAVTEILAEADALRATVEGADNLTEEQKTQATSRIDEAIGLAREAAEAEQERAALDATLQQAPQLLEALNERETQILDPIDVETLLAQPLDVLEGDLSDLRGSVAALQLGRDESNRRLNELIATSRSDASELTDLESRLANLTAADPVSTSEDTLTAVEELWREARKRRLNARIELIRLRQGSIGTLTELARRKVDVAKAKLDAAQDRLALLLEAVQKKRQKEAEAVISATEQVDLAAPTGLRAIQGEIADLAREQQGLLAKETEYQRQLDRVKQTSDRLKLDYDRIQRIVELGGSSAQVSTLLQKRREIAPSPEGLGSEAFALQQRLTDASLRQIELDEILQQLIDTDATVAYLSAAHGLEPTTSANEGFIEVARLYRDTVLELWQSYTRYLAVLSQLEVSTRSLADEAERYEGFINDRLLWVPSSELIPLSEPLLLLEGASWFVEQATLEALVEDLTRLPRERFGAVLLWLVAGALLLGLRGRALAALDRCESETRKVRTDNFRATLAALLATLVLIAWLPWLLIGAGLLLGQLPNASNASLTYAAGLQAIGQVTLFLGGIRQLCRPRGLAVAHLNWQPSLCESLGRQAAWLLPIAAPLGFLVSAGSASVPSEFIRLGATPQLEDAGVVALGRFAFAAQMLALLVAVHRVWRKNGAVMTAFADHPERGKWASYHVLWFGPSLLAPLLLAAWALLGYFYSAVYILSVAGETLWFILTAILGRDLLFRGLYVTQRRLRFQEALRHRDELIAQRAEASSGGGVAAGKADEAIEEEKVDYRELGDQVRSLVQFGYTLGILVGLWWIWRDIFPAFSFLDSIELPITTSQLVDGVTQDVPLTLSDMIAGLLLGGLALFAAMKVPAVLELTLLQRLPLSRASRYAFTTLLQYTVAMIGLVITFNALGLQWSSIQWLVAALSVGLGFGLQEIVANFISGIILLFEQPIRVGDIVTVDGTTGTVSKIRIRATTIVNYDRQELVIPNKTFITGQLINWTLSDTVNRVFVTVGVSYASDTRKAMELIREAAQEHSNVLNEPEPIITFEAFGDNALTLNLRAYLGNMDRRLLTITELHQAILDKFREAGIEIAFPQRDVHLTTIEPLELKLKR